jgi:23S rRNA (guanosine2251-2'-O)-methyltransferase
MSGPGSRSHEGRESARSGGSGRKGRPSSPPVHAEEGLGGQKVEGFHAVHQLLVSGRRQVKRIWLAGPQVAGPLAALASRRGVRTEVKTPDALMEAASTAAPQGVIAWAAPVQPVALEDLLKPRAAGGEVFLVVLDGVTDPGNFGALVRSAACAGAQGVVVGRHRSAPLTPAAVKSAAGAVDVVDFAVVAGVPSALQVLARAGVWVVGLGPDGSDDIWSAPALDGPVALVVGAEGSGLTRLARQRCDTVARIPQVGPIGSLNVAAASAVACFEVARRRALRRASPSSASRG